MSQLFPVGEWSLWEPHAKPVFMSTSACKEIDTAHPLPDGVVLVREQVYRVPLADGTERFYTHYHVTPREPKLQADLSGKGADIELRECYPGPLPSAGGEWTEEDFDDMTKECDAYCLAIGWALEQWFKDEKQPMASRVDAFMVCAWLYANPLQLHQVWEHSMWAAGFIYDALTHYDLCDSHNDFVCLYAGSAKAILKRRLYDVPEALADTIVQSEIQPTWCPRFLVGECQSLGDCENGLHPKDAVIDNDLCGYFRTGRCGYHADECTRFHAFTREAIPPSGRECLICKEPMKLGRKQAVLPCCNCDCHFDCIVKWYSLQVNKGDVSASGSLPRLGPDGRFLLENLHPREWKNLAPTCPRCKQPLFIFMGVAHAPSSLSERRHVFATLWRRFLRKTSSTTDKRSDVCKYFITAAAMAKDEGCTASTDIRKAARSACFNTRCLDMINAGMHYVDEEQLVCAFCHPEPSIAVKEGLNLIARYPGTPVSTPRVMKIPAEGVSKQIGSTDTEVTVVEGGVVSTEL